VLSSAGSGKEEAMSRFSVNLEREPQAFISPLVALADLAAAGLKGGGVRWEASDA